LGATQAANVYLLDAKSLASLRDER